MEFRYLKTLVPCRDVFGCKTGKYRNLRNGCLLQYRTKGKWMDIEEVTEVVDD